MPKNAKRFTTSILGLFLFLFRVFRGLLLTCREVQVCSGLYTFIYVGNLYAKSDPWGSFREVYRSRSLRGDPKGAPRPSGFRGNPRSFRSVSLRSGVVGNDPFLFFLSPPSLSAFCAPHIEISAF